MKKISKIFAVVICLAMAVTMLSVAVCAAENSVDFTPDSLGLAAYNATAESTTVGGITVEWIQLASYGDGIQMRDSEKDGEMRTSRLWNTSAAGTGITKIELTYSDSKNTYDNTDIMIINFGETVKGADYTTKLSTTAGNKTYTITPNSDTYDFFYIEWDSTYSGYWASIKVYYNGEAGGSTPVQPEQPEQPELDIVPISTALAGKDGETFMVKGVVTLLDGKNVYVQDATGGICVRMSENPTDLALGDTIIGTGSKSVYNGLPQLGGSYEKSEGETLSAKEVTLDSLDKADICTYVKLSGLTVVDYFDNDGAYQYPNVTLSDGENEIELYKGVVEGIKVGDVVDVTCALSYYAKGDTEKFQLRNTLVEEVVLATGDDTTGDDTTGDDTTGDDTTGDDTTGDDSTGEDIPVTADISVLAAVLAGLCATAALVVVTKKEQ